MTNAPGRQTRPLSSSGHGIVRTADVSTVERKRKMRDSAGLSIWNRRQSNHTQNVMKTGDGTLVDLLLVRKTSTAPSHTDGRFNNSRLHGA